jgi:GAF domain-containing protein
VDTLAGPVDLATAGLDRTAVIDYRRVSRTEPLDTSGTDEHVMCAAAGRDEGAGAATALVVLGVALVAAAVAHGGRYGVSDTQVLVAATPGMLLLVGLAWVVWSSLHAEAYRTVARWVFGGLAVFGGGVTGALLLGPEAGFSTELSTRLSLFFAGIGAVGGLLVGVKSVHAVEAARRAEEARTSAVLAVAERDRLSYLSEASRGMVGARDGVVVARAVAAGLDRALPDGGVGVWLADRGGELAPATDATPSRPDPAGRESFDAGEERTVERSSGACLHVPLVGRGLLSVTFPDGPRDGRAEELVRVFARTAGSALERAGKDRELERQNDRLEAFAGVVSHDLRAPLSVIEGRAELALAEEDVSHVESVLRNVDRMDRLIEDLLTMAREGQDEAKRRPVRLTRLVRDAWNGIEAGEAILEVTDLPVFEVDPEGFRRVFENLFRNAVEHGGGDVTVTVGPLADGSGVHVTDDGPGVPADEREAVFERGYTTGGTGFGLAIVDGIVRSHGGIVELHEGETGGARFEIRDVGADTDPTG